MKKIFILLTLVFANNLYAQNIERVEYYIDTDPGYGMAVPVTFKDYDVNFIVDLSEVSTGFHVLYVRVMDENGTWSLTHTRPFVVDQTAPEITAAEYYLDTDPGYGSGTDIPITPASTIDDNYTFDLSDISTGFHVLHVRVMDKSGTWSLRYTKPFFVDQTAPDITEAEYYLDTDPGYGNGTVIPITPASTIDDNYIFDLSETNTGFHVLHVRVMDKSGTWSLRYTKPFFVDQVASGANIVAIEYFFTNENIKTTPISFTDFTPSKNIDVNFNVDVIGFITDSTYKIVTSAVDDAGGRSLSYIHQFLFSDKLLSITLTSPAGGEIWKGGSEQDITWDSKNIDNISIEYSTNGGSNWKKIVSSIDAYESSYTWTVPDTPSENCMVRITSVSEALLTDRSENVFTILPEPTITVTSPNGGEKWAESTLRNITWTITNVDSVIIEYSSDDGVNWSGISESLNAEKGSYTWTVPDTPSENCLIQITDISDASVFDRSDGFLTILPPPSVTIKSPNGGEKWTSGTEVEITWTSINVGGVKIEYSINDGVDWIVIKESIAASKGSFTWTVPDTLSEKCRVRITDISNESVTDESDNIFSIIEEPKAITVSSPNGGEDWIQNTSHDITWTSTKVDSIRIEYSIESETNWTLIVASVSADSGLYSWEVPDTPSINCLVKVTDTSDSSITDQSDSTFTISEIYADYPFNGNANDLSSQGNHGTVYGAELSEDRFGNSNSAYSFDGVDDYIGTNSSILNNLEAFTITGWIKPLSGGNRVGFFGQNDVIELGFISNTTINLWMTQNEIGLQADYLFALNEWHFITCIGDGNTLKLYIDSVLADSSAFSAPNYGSSEYYFNIGGGGVFDPSGNFYKGFIDDIRVYNSALTEPEIKTIFHEGGWDPPPAAPLKLNATSGNQQIYLHWIPNSEPDLNKYNIYRDISSPATTLIDSVVVSSPSDTTYTDSGLINEQIYYYRITAVDSLGNESSYSNEVQAIYQGITLPSVTLISPNGDENWTVGTSQYITWTSSNVTDVKIEYSTDNSLNWTTITSSTDASTGSYSWIVPYIESSDCLIRITNTVDSSITAVSSDVFTIISENYITVTSPAAGYRWSVGSEYEINWEFIGITDVRIEYSTDNGESWLVIVESISSLTGSYNWNVPEEPSSQCKIRITDVSDSSVNDATDLFEIFLPDIRVIHEPITESPENTSITFDANVISGEDIQIVTLYYDVTGRRVFDKSLEMNASSGSDYSTALGVGVFTAMGLEYYIIARDINNLETRVPSGSSYYSIRAEVSESVSAQEIQGGTEVTGYRMISIPLELSQTSIVDQLSGRLPPGNSGTGWRLFRFPPGTSTPQEYPDIEGFSPGKAFWLITKENFRLKTIPGKTVATSEPFNIELKSGWNDIANPWMFDISWDDIENPSGANLSVLYTYEGSWSDPLEPPIVLEPWKGYAVLNLMNMNVVIRLKPTYSTIVEKSVIKNQLEWMITIKAFAGEASDNANHFGTSYRARKEWDHYDHVEPQPIGQYVSVYFPHRDWKQYPYDYTVDFRPPESTLSWDFDVKTNISRETVTVKIEGIEDLPEEHYVKLYDRDSRHAVDFNNNTFSFVSEKNFTERHFMIVVGNTDKPELEEYESRPERFVTAMCFPNPFNPQTTIRYELSMAGKVVISVYNALGQQVKVYNLGQKDQGVHEFVFKATELTSGLYIYRVDAGYSSVTRKMLYMK